MLDHFWMLNSHRFEAEELERILRLRARWAERGPLTPPAVGYRRRLAKLLLVAAGWLDPRPAQAEQPAWTPPKTTCDGRVAFLAMQRYRLAR